MKTLEGSQSKQSKASKRNPLHHPNLLHPMVAAYGRKQKTNVSNLKIWPTTRLTCKDPPPIVIAWCRWVPFHFMSYSLWKRWSAKASFPK
jgi:hypothetical protein